MNAWFYENLRTGGTAWAKPFLLGRLDAREAAGYDDGEGVDEETDRLNMSRAD